MTATCPVCGRRTRLSKGVLVQHRVDGSVCPQSGSEVRGVADDVLAIIESPQGEMFCPHCEHFIDWHMGLPFNGGPNGEWRFRCRCGCTVDCPTQSGIRRLDPDTAEAPDSGSNEAVS